VRVIGGGSIDVEGGRITGPLVVTSATGVRLCGATITGPLTISGSSSTVLAGGDAATGPCDANTFIGPVGVTGNTAGVEFNRNPSSDRSGSRGTPAAWRRRTPAPYTPSATP